MKATPSQQATLLTLQALDTALLRLRRSKQQLPERASLAELQGEASQAKDEFMRIQRQLDSQAAEIARVEDDTETVRSRRKRDEALLEGTASIKEIQALQGELEALARRQSELEDRELELMEANERTSAEMEAASSRLAGVEGKRETLIRAIADAESRLDSEFAAASEERAGLAAEVQRDLLELYERTRDRSGIGAARLRGNVSEGSNMALAPAELADLRAAPADEVVFCPQSGAILVRDAD